MGAIASQITSLTILYLIVYSDADQRNIKVPRHWPLCGEFTGDRWIPRTNGQWRGKCFHLMTSSCLILIWYYRISGLSLIHVVATFWSSWWNNHNTVAPGHHLPITKHIIGFITKTRCRYTLIHVHLATYFADIYLMLRYGYKILHVTLLCGM